jgi:UV DNA damage endonuclease
VRIGYPCINRTISCSGNKTFRLKSYSETRLKETIHNNLDCLQHILKFNLEHHLLFFRITSDLVPFASHPINTFDWKKHFRSVFESIGEFIRENRMRISMHPDQFTLINSISDDVLERSIKELKYHVEIFDLMNLDAAAKVQIHVGGVYGDKETSIKRFVKRYQDLDDSIKRRLVIENDDKLYDLVDCLRISEKTEVPVLFDVFHHRLNSSTKLPDEDCLKFTIETWDAMIDGLPMVDYSSQKPFGVPRQHAETIDLDDFSLFLKETAMFDFDVMLEIKDKEKSAIKAFNLAVTDSRVAY